MKKILLLTVLTVFSCRAFAQVSLIPKAGINVANVALDNDRDLDGQKSLIGLTAGLGFNFALTSDNFLSIQPEILYSQKGWAAQSSNLLASYDGTFRLNYLEVPILVKVNFGGEVIKAYVNAGPSFGYLIGGRLKGNWNALGFLGSDIDESLKFTDTPSLASLNELDANRIEIGANFGGGVGFALGGNVIFIDLRYNMGLTDYNRDYESKNRVFAFTAGLQIPLRE